MRQARQTRGRRLGARVAAAALIAGSAACLPEAPEPWLVDHTIGAALQVRVVEAGAWSAESPRADREIGEVMPGDTIRPAPLVIGPDGPVDLSERPPRYFYCDPQRCFDDVARPGGVPDCEAEEPVPPTRTCELRGGTLRLGALTRLLQVSALFMIAGGPDGADADTCVRRLRRLDGAVETLQDCVMTVQPLLFGPTWRLMLLAAYLGVPDAAPLAGVTAGVTAAEPDLFPGEPALTVRVEDPGAPPRTLTAARGATIAARPGATIAVTAEVDIRDTQERWYFQGDGTFAATNEVLTIAWLFTDAVEWTAPELLAVRFTAPAQPGPLYVYGLLGDGALITGTWLRFEVEGP